MSSSCSISNIVSWAGTCYGNQHNTFEVSMFSHYDDIKGNAKCRNWGGLGVMSQSATEGHQQCHHLIECI